MIRTSATHYFDGEGRDYMELCVIQTFGFAIDAKVDTIVMFTGSGDGPMYALQTLLPDQKYHHLRIIAVTPPAGRLYIVDPANDKREYARAGIQNPARRTLLETGGIRIVTANLPFKPIQGLAPTALASIGEAFGMFGGGLALCVQAILMACDAGEIEVGSRVAALTADTSIIALASRTESVLSPTEGLLVEHIICRPNSYPISKSQHMYAHQLWSDHIDHVDVDSETQESPATLDDKQISAASPLEPDQ